MKVTDKITITNECNLELMKRFPDNHFDLAIVDPPYGIDVANINFGARELKNKSCDNKDWDKYIPSKKYFDELMRISKEQIIWGANYFNCFSGNNGAIIWDKLQPLPTSSQCEIASYSRLKKVFKYTQRWTNFVNTKISNHPTEKPLELYRYLLDNFAKENDKILDTHLGSGSIAIACHDYGFELTACELDKEYYDKAIQRIKNHVSQQKLF
jgi:site-specific DNA-methyltransferase (adenine-specific)